MAIQVHMFSNQIEERTINYTIQIKNSEESVGEWQREWERESLFFEDTEKIIWQKLDALVSSNEIRQLDV